MKRLMLLSTMLILVLSTMLLTNCKKDNPAPPTSNFTITGDNNPAPCQVFFNNTSTNASSYLWEFGDGSSSTEQSPSHIYTNAGTYIAKLTAVGAGGTNTSSQALVVTVPAPVADFTFYGDNNPAPCNVAFTNTSLYANSYYWDFDDGYYSTQRDVVHTFTAGGTYHVTLTAYGEGGSSLAYANIVVTTAGTNVTFNNPVYTDITVTMDGYSQVISPGGSVTFPSVLGSLASYYASTSGKTNQGTQIGELMEWSNTISLPGGSVSYNLVVSNNYFFLYLRNNGTHTLTPIYVNYGLASQTVDNVLVPADNVKYRTGYYKAWTNSIVRAYYYDNPSAYTYWQNLNMPWTENQSLELVNTFKSFSGTDHSNTQVLSPESLHPATDMLKHAAFDKSSINVKCK